MKLSLRSLALVLLPLSAAAQPVIQNRGVDFRVDYAGLKEIGPWDDRNYALTFEDLALLAPNEKELRDPIPAFYRVLLRHQNPGLPRAGEGQYPRSALNKFYLAYGGYLVDGQLYRRLDFDGRRYEVILEQGESHAEFLAEDLGEKAASGEIRITTPNDAAESAIALSPVNTNLVIAGSNGPAGGQRMHWSTNGGAAWTQVSLPLGGTCCDPTVDWSSDGTKAYTATLGGASGVWFYRSANGGQTWNDLEVHTPGDPRREVSTSASADKEYLHVDRHATSPFKDRLYLCWHESNIQRFSRSADLGNTWSAVQILSGAGENGIGCDLATDKNGHLYYFWPNTSTGRILMRKSTDGGVNFAPTVQVADTLGQFDFPVPVMEDRLVFIYVSADVDRTAGPYANRIYAAWTDNNNADSGIPTNNHARIQVGWSSDGGATWNLRTPHETADVLTVDRFHQWLAVDGRGDVHVVFYDTRNDPATRNVVDIYHSVSTDGGDTWSTPTRRTTVSSPNINDGFEWGDYNGLSVITGELLGIYTDNRDEGGGALESVDVYGVGFDSANFLFANDFETGDTSGWTLAEP